MVIRNAEKSEHEIPGSDSILHYGEMNTKDCSKARFYKQGLRRFLFVCSSNPSIATADFNFITFKVFYGNCFHNDV